MHATADIAPRPRRRMRRWKIVLLAVVGLALLEPVIMYTLLEHQRSARERARTPAELQVTKSAGR